MLVRLSMCACHGVCMRMFMHIVMSGFGVCVQFYSANLLDDVSIVNQSLS